MLDPIDGTKGFVKGEGALFVVGLALVVDGKIVLGIMGCPNWSEDISCDSCTETNGNKHVPSGTIMVAHRGYGTWMRTLSDIGAAKPSRSWTKCSVDEFSTVKKARFCISDSETWDFMPLSTFFNATIDADNVGDKYILILPTCCGSLVKYLMVASGRASVFILRAKQQTIEQRTIKAWDHAAGQICVHEAGGRVTDWIGSQLNYAEDEAERRNIFPSDGVLVSNGSVHNQIIEMVSAYVPV